MTSYPADKSTDLALAHVAASEDEKITQSSYDNRDDVMEGSEGVTHHEFETLRHMPDNLPWASWLILFVEFAERWTYYGTTNLYANYIRAHLPPGSVDGSVLPENRDGGVAGALGLGVQKAFAIRTFNTFWVYVTPVFGAIIADTLLGRYKTILVFSLVCLAGHIILVGGSVPSAIAKGDVALGLLVVSILIMGVGAGAIKSNVSPMIAEQYTGKMRKETLKSGEVIIKSPALTIQRVYLWFYAGINLGSCGAISAAFIARDHGYWPAFLVPTGIFALVPGILFLGRKIYVRTSPRGSILLETFRVIKIALASVWSWNPATLIRGIRSPTFYDVAKPSFYGEGQVPAKITWDDEFVGEVRRTVKACCVFVLMPFWHLCYSQIEGNLTTLAAAMKLGGTPNDLIQNLNPISIVFMIPLMDFVFYPLLRKWGINFTPIKRIYAGFLVAASAMLYSAILQHFLYKMSPCHDNLPSECEKADGNPWPAPLNVWILAGPFILVGLSEILANVTAQEYAFTKAPKRMKSVVMSFYQLQSAVSSALNFALTPVNVEDRFAWLFGAFAVTAVVIGTIFMFLFRHLDAEERELNLIGTGERKGFEGEDESPERKA